MLVIKKKFHTSITIIIVVVLTSVQIIFFNKILRMFPQSKPNIQTHTLSPVIHFSEKESKYAFSFIYQAIKILEQIGITDISPKILGMTIEYLKLSRTEAAIENEISPHFENLGYTFDDKQLLSFITDIIASTPISKNSRNLFVLTGRPALGKSLLARNISQHVAYSKAVDGDGYVRGTRAERNKAEKSGNTKVKFLIDEQLEDAKTLSTSREKVPIRTFRALDGEVLIGGTSGKEVINPNIETVIWETAAFVGDISNFKTLSALSKNTFFLAAADVTGLVNRVTRDFIHHNLAGLPLKHFLKSDLRRLKDQMMRYNWPLMTLSDYVILIHASPRESKYLSEFPFKYTYSVHKRIQPPYPDLAILRSI